MADSVIQTFLNPEIIAGRVGPEALAAAAARPGALPIPGVTLHRPEVHAEEPLRAELRAFVESVRTRQQPPIPLEDGRRALAVALTITEAMADHHRQADLDRVTAGR